jgi:signal transduction histidine kinase
VEERTRDLRQAHESLIESHGQLIQHRDQLLQAEKLALLGQISAGVAHEINNPVAYIASNLETMQSRLDQLETHINQLHELARASNADNLETVGAASGDSIGIAGEFPHDNLLNEFNDMIGESLHGTNRIRRLVRDLGMYAHSTGEVPQESDINQLVESSLRMAGHELNSGQTVRVNLDCNSRIECYPDLLEQVFVILLVNAAQAVKAGGVIKIATRDDDNHVVVSVSDNGPGIDPDLLPRLFDPFFTTKPAGEGTGLGLSICEKHVKSHGGRIAVTSTPGKGSTFTVILPRQPVNPGE